jgi:hypothetical protein
MKSKKYKYCIGNKEIREKGKGIREKGYSKANLQIADFFESY